MKKITWKKFIHISELIFDIILICFVIGMIYVVCSLNITRKKIGIPMVANYSLVKIASGSMVDAGFEIGDNVIIKKQKEIKAYEVGDFIAFFECVDMNVMSPYEANITGNSPSKDPRGSIIVFHEIQQIMIDNNAGRWYVTKGSNNKYNDAYAIYENYVIGEYQDKLKMLASFLKFLLSIKGVLLIVVLPCSIIIFKNCYVVVDIIIKSNEKKSKNKKEQN